MQIGLIGDVHQEDLALAWALAWLADQQVDLCVCVGDIADGFGNLDACCELLDSHGVITVRGNHDRWFLKQQLRDLPQASPLEAASPESREWLGELPATEPLRHIGRHFGRQHRPVEHLGRELPLRSRSTEDDALDDQKQDDERDEREADPPVKTAVPRMSGDTDGH
jgi:hypothetical protein